MAFYTYIQNNSGGCFQNEPDNGICEYVIIEAPNATAANAKAQKIGLYFDGIERQIDCACCGPRWDPAEATDGTKTPQIYGVCINKRKRDYFNKECCVHYLTGDFKFFEFPNG